MIHAMATISDLTKRVKQLEVENLNMRDALDRIATFCEHVEEVEELCECSTQMTIEANRALIRTLHTETLAHRVEALEAVAEAAPGKSGESEKQWKENLIRALEKLKEVNKEYGKNE